MSWCFEVICSKCLKRIRAALMISTQSFCIPSWCQRVYHQHLYLLHLDVPWRAPWWDGDENYIIYLTWSPENVSIEQFSKICIWSILSQASTEAPFSLSFLPNSFFISFWQGGKSGQGVPLNASNLEKWTKPGFLMACIAAESNRKSGLARDTWQGSPLLPPHCKECIVPKTSHLKRTKLLNAVSSESY